MEGSWVDMSGFAWVYRITMHYWVLGQMRNDPPLTRRRPCTELACGILSISTHCGWRLRFALNKSLATITEMMVICIIILLYYHIIILLYYKFNNLIILLCYYIIILYYITILLLLNIIIIITVHLIYPMIFSWKIPWNLVRASVSYRVHLTRSPGTQPAVSSAKKRAARVFSSFGAGF